MITVPELITIVVPIYNREQYLKRLFDSVLAQTYTNWECICIDDGSTDNSLSICNKYAQADNRFKVLSQKNSGVSATRNKGIDNSKGTWIVFVDSDDSIAPQYLEHLYEPIRKESVDLVVGGYLVNPNSNKEYHWSYQEETFTRNNWPSKVYPYSFLYNVGKLHKTSIIKQYNIRWTEKYHLAEDYLFTLQYYMHAEKVALVPYLDYYCFQEKEKNEPIPLHLSLHEPQIAVVLWNEIHCIITQMIKENPSKKQHIIDSSDLFRRFYCTYWRIQTAPDISLKQRVYYMKQVPTEFVPLPTEGIIDSIRNFLLQRKWFYLFSLSFYFTRKKLRNSPL